MGKREYMHEPMTAHTAYLVGNILFKMFLDFQISEL